MTTLSRDQVEQFLRLATLDRAIVNVDGWIGVYSALRLMIDHDAAQRARIKAHEKRWHDACTHDYDISLLDKIDTEKARMTPIIEALESLCHAVERGDTDDDYLRQLAQDGRRSITLPKEGVK